MDKFTLDTKSQNKWINNIIVFLAPLGILYLSTVIGTVSTSAVGFRVEQLIPNTFAQGGLVLWVLNALLDYLRKLQAK